MGCEKGENALSCMSAAVEATTSLSLARMEARAPSKAETSGVNVTDVLQTPMVRKKTGTTCCSASSAAAVVVATEAPPPPA